VNADFCDDCGNCDVFCPEDGGPHLIKPLTFLHLLEWMREVLDSGPTYRALLA